VGGLPDDADRHELDPRVRRALYRAANRIVCDDAPWAFTYFFRYFVIWQPYVHGYGVHAVWNEYAADAWVDRDEAQASRGLPLLWPNALASLTRGPRRR